MTESRKKDAGLPQERLEQLQENLAEVFQDWLDNPGELTAAQANVIRQFLKENGQLSTSRRRSAIHSLSDAAKEQMPFDHETHAG